MSIYRRGKVWHYDFAIRGRRFRGSTDATDRAQALRIETKLRADAVEFIRLGKAREMSVAEAFVKYLDHADHLPSAYTVTKQIVKLRALSGGLMLSELTDAHIAEYVATRRGQKARNKDGLISNATVNRELATLRAVMRRAAEQWGVNVASIKWKAHLLREAQERRRYLTVDEQERLLEALRPDLRPLVRFCLLTGARFGSAVALTWSDVDFHDESLTFRKMKGGGVHSVPVPQEVIALIANERGHHPIFVFSYECQEDRPAGANGVRRRKGERYPFSPDGWRRAWKSALKAARIDGFRFHDLRHTALSRVTKVSGIAVAQALAGHADISTTKRYAHVLADDVREAMARAARHTKDAALAANIENQRKDKAL